MYTYVYTCHVLYMIYVFIIYMIMFINSSLSS